MAVQLSSSELAELGLAGVPRVSWPEHVAYLDENWQAGQHVSIFARTGGGKTKLTRRLLEVLWWRYRVLFIASKRRDSTIAGLGRVVHRFPSWDQRARYELRRQDSPAWETDPEWYVLKTPGYEWSPQHGDRSPSWRAARNAVGLAISSVRKEGKWVFVPDEIRAISDAQPPSLGLQAPLASLYREGRSEEVTIIAGTQSPRWAPGEFYDQWTYAYFGRMSDVAKQIRLGEIGGHTDEIRAVLPTLERYEFLFVDSESDVLQIVRAPA